MDNEGISDQAPQMAKLDYEMDEPVRKVRELADTCDALADKVTSAPCDAIPMAAGVVADPAQHTGAVIIRDPSLTCARILGDQSGVGLNANFVFPTVRGGRDTAA
jgi:hypothetical protein